MLRERRRRKNEEMTGVQKKKYEAMPATARKIIILAKKQLRCGFFFQV